MNDNNLPTHIAIIMDGNGRWAKKRMMPRNLGHKKGVLALENIVKHTMELGIKYLTVYAFSTENWNRNQDEINGLFDLFRGFFKQLKSEYTDKGVRIRFLGDLSKFPEDIQQACNEMQDVSRDCEKLNFNVCLNYGARDEIINAIKKMKEQNFEINKENFASCLYTAGMPDPDLVIRTSGEMRISNFLLYQIAYSEIYVTKTLWPDFGKKEYQRAIDAFKNRERRFGK